MQDVLAQGMRAMRLIFQDTDDLTVVSAHLQDSLVRVGDLIRLPRHRRLAFIADRFCWDDVRRPLGFLPPVGPYKRIRTGVHFDGVTEVRMRGIDTSAPDTVLELLAVTFTPDVAPGGVLTLDFAGGAALALTVECIEGALADQGAPYESAHLPRHRRA